MIWIILVAGALLLAVAIFMAMGGGLSGGHSNLLIWGAGLLVTVLIAAVVYVRMADGQRHQQALQERGLRGAVEILRVESTNVVVNRRPQARLQLRVHLPGRAPYELEHVTMMPLVGFAPTPGQRYPVLVNPDQPDDLMIDWTTPGQQGASGSSTQSPAQRLEALDELHRKGLVSTEEYERKRAQILSDL